MSQVVGLPNNSCKPITNTAWVCARLCRLRKGCTRPGTPSDKAYQLLSHGRWFSSGTSVSSSTKTGCHDIAEILLKVALSTNNQIKSFGVVIVHFCIAMMCYLYFVLISILYIVSTFCIYFLLLLHVLQNVIVTG